MKVKYYFSTKEDKNLAYHVQDKKQNVDKARNNLSIKLKYDSKKLKFMDQVHGNEVQIVNETHSVYKCDAIVTDQLDTPLMVMVADCIPILFFDEEKNCIAAAHAGRNGVYLNIVFNVLQVMKQEFSCNSENIKVVLGPSIQKCCYEVSKELADIAIKSFGKQYENNRYIDLQGIVQQQLLDVGIARKNIETSEICTKCGSSKYFSYRKDKLCGRFAGIITLVS